MKTRYRVALPTAFSFVALLIVLALSTRGAGSNPATSPGDAPALPPPSNGAISPQDQADALHLLGGSICNPGVPTLPRPRFARPSPCAMSRRFP